MRKCALGLVLAWALTATAWATPPLDAAAAKAAFAEAKAASDRDGGKLWGMELYGPMLFVDRETKKIIANGPDAEGKLHAEDGVYVGTLPPDTLIANTAFDWGGTRWTMVEWPLWGDDESRAHLMEHELYHRIQPALHLLLSDRENPHLDTLEGRLLLQLEWRALAAALASDGAARVQAVRDALSFRARRHALFAGSQESERVMEINEGLAEYTGVVLSVPDAASARWAAIRKLVNADEQTWVRSFPYTSGPAYGLLLDLFSPGWRRTLTEKSDIAAMLAAALSKGAPGDAAARAKRYGEASLRLRETARAAEAEKVKARYRARLVDGPTLNLPNLGTHFRVSFDPRNLVPLGDAGTVYPTIVVSDEWGELKVTDGALMPMFRSVTVPAPASTAGPHVTGDGWTLDLAPGWSLVPEGKPGCFTVKKQ